MKEYSDNFVEGIIKRTINRKITVKQASIQLGISRQYIYKLEQKYMQSGISCFKHGNTGKQKEWKTDTTIEQTIIELYSNKYVGFCLTV